METKKVTIGNPVTVAGVTLIPVSEISLSHRPAAGALYVLGTHQPLGILVVSPASRTAFRITGEQVDPDRFIQETPGLKEALAEQSVF